MGYTTYFNGGFAVTPTLRPEHKAYLEAFANTRRVQRDAEKAEQLPDPLRIAAGLPIGYEGAYFVGGDGYKGQGSDPSVTDGNNPPGSPPHKGLDKWAEIEQLKAVAVEIGLGQPGLWCQWVPNEDGTYIIWDEGEKFYEYIPWIKYLIHHFLAPWGYTLNGYVTWSGEEDDDRGAIRITDNKVEIGIANITYDFS